MTVAVAGSAMVMVGCNHHGQKYRSVNNADQAKEMPRVDQAEAGPASSNNNAPELQSASQASDIVPSTPSKNNLSNDNSAKAQPSQPESSPGINKTYYLSDIRFQGISGDLIEPSQLMQLPLLRSTIQGIETDAPLTEHTASTNQSGADSHIRPNREVDIHTLNAIVREVSRAYTDAGYAAVRVTILRGSLARIEEPDGDGVLMIDVTEGRIAEVRTRSLANEDGINRQSDAVIRDHSPIAVGDPVTLKHVENYVDFLNRHPRRRIDAALSPSDKPGEIIFDYLIYDAKPWLAYVQTSNTGTEGTTEWRKQVGAIHYDLTGADDILSINYAGGDFDATHAASISYERPFADAPRWRWRVFGDWSRYDASEVGLPGVSFQGETWGAGGELLWNFKQSDGWFFDLIGGARFRNAMTDNAFASLTGDTDYLIPYVGLRVENREADSATTGQMMFETNLPNMAGTDRNQVQRLGRTGADDQWVVFRQEASHAFYLDTLHNDQTGRVENHRPLVNELLATMRGQVVLGDERLPTNYTSAIGGFYSVRGYPEVFASADNSVVGTLEYRYHLPRGLSPNPQAGRLFDSPFRYRPQDVGGHTDWDLILKTFIDAGRVWHNERFSFEDNVTLIGAGVGMELQIKQNFSFRADWGWALRDAVNGSERVEAGSSQAHFLFTLTF